MAETTNVDYGGMTKAQLISELKAAHRGTARAEDQAAACETRYSELFEDSSIRVWDDDWSEVKILLDGLAMEGVTDFHDYLKQDPEKFIHSFRTVAVSKGMAELYGAPSSEALRDRWESTVTAEEIDCLLDTVTAFMGGATSHEYETEERKFDGAPIMTFSTVTISPERVQDWSRVIVSVMDITARKNAERALHESESRMRAYFDNSPTAMSLKDRDGRFLLINPEFEKALGLTSEKVRGKKAHDLYPEVAADNIRAREREVIKTGNAIDWEQEITTEDSTNYWLLSKFPIRDAAGLIVSIGSVATNVTKTKNAEKAVLESEARFSAFINHSPNLIALKDLDGRYIHMNPAGLEIVGNTMEEIKGLRSSDVFEHHFSQPCMDHDRAVLDAGHAIEREENFMKNGELHAFMTQKFPLRDSDGKISGIGVICTDITERREIDRVTETALDASEMANRSKSEFLANMSHELRTPLNAIIGFSEIMLGELLGPIGSAKYLEYAGDIHSAGSHLMELINDILDISKVESGNVELNEEIFDIDEAMNSCMAMIRERAVQGEVEIKCEKAPNLPSLYADERKFKQILLNLLSNAIKFTPAGGKVIVRAWSSDRDGYVFQVEDTGIGIALADIPKALAPFQQIDSALNRRYDGTGLGLPLTKALAELHGGSLGLESEVGVGTTVTVRIPKERVVTAESLGVA